MLRIGMLLSCILMTKSMDEMGNELGTGTLTGTLAGTLAGITVNDTYASSTSTTTTTTKTTTTTVTCYICVNVSDNIICNRYAIDRPCKSGETFCHTLHVMDSKGTSVLVNKKCTTSKECQKNKVGCVEVDTQMMCVSCCNRDYCNVNMPTNYTNAIYEDKFDKSAKTKMAAGTHNSMDNSVVVKESEVVSRNHASTSKRHLSVVWSLLATIVMTNDNATFRYNVFFCYFLFLFFLF